MRSFSLPVSGKQLSFDLGGQVFDTTAHRVGTWRTAANTIVCSRDGLPDTMIPVDWAFNASNQLTISKDGAVVFAFTSTPEGLPTYSLERNVLKVDPIGDRHFVFDLAGLFGLDQDGNLIVSIRGRQSTLDGYFEDTQSQFRFRFDDLDTTTIPSDLVFSGRWERVTAVDNEVRLHFLLDDPALEIAARPLDLPAAVEIDRTKNHLVMRYRSRSNGTSSLQFAGSLRIAPDFTLSFEIGSVKDTVRTTTIDVATTFAWNAAQGVLQLHVGKTAGADSQILEIGGSLKATLKNGSLTWDFAYQKDTAGGQTTTSIATAVTFTLKDASIFINYSQNGSSRSLDITGKLTTADFALDGGVRIMNDPTGRSLGAFIGISW